MADTKISQLPQVQSLGVSDIIPIVASGATSRIPFSGLKSNTIGPGIYIITAPPYSAVGDGSTNNTTAIQNCFNDAGSYGVANGQATVVIPPGNYNVTNVSLPHRCNLIMHGTLIGNSSSDPNNPILRIGDDTIIGPGDQFFLGLRVKAGTNFHGYRDDLYGITQAAVRLSGVHSSMITLSRLEGCLIGLQLYAPPNWYTAYNTIFGGEIVACKWAIDLHSTTPSNGGGWTNENKFYGQKILGSTQIDAYGSVCGVQFSSVASGYTQANQNVFNGQSFEVGQLNTSYAWSSGKTGLAVGNHYYNSLGYEYIMLDSGTGGTDEPTVTSGTYTDNAGKRWKFNRLQIFKCPVWYNNAGQNNIVTDVRWESGFGPFAFFTNFVWGGNRHRVYARAGVTSNALTARYIGDYCVPEITDAHSFGLDNTIECYSETSSNINHRYTLDNWHHRMVGSGNYLTVAGMAFVSLGDKSITQHSNNTGSFILTNNGVVIGTYDRCPFAAVNTSALKKWLVERDGDVAAGIRLDLFAMDADWQVLDANDTTRNIYVSNTHTGQTGAFKWMREGSPGFGTIIFATPDGTTPYYVGAMINTQTSGVSVRSISFRYMPDAFGTVGQMQVATPFGAAANLTRTAYGTPTIGIFNKVGEFIGNINTAAAQPVGWYTKTAGYLAPAWVTATAIWNQEIRTNAGKAYAATNATGAVTGATAPTHTSGTVSDGTVNWTYLGVTAVLTAATQTY